MPNFPNKISNDKSNPIVIESESEKPECKNSLMRLTFAESDRIFTCTNETAMRDGIESCKLKFRLSNCKKKSTTSGGGGGGLINQVVTVLEAQNNCFSLAKSPTINLTDICATTPGVNNSKPNPTNTRFYKTFFYNLRVLQNEYAFIS